MLVLTRKIGEVVRNASSSASGAVGAPPDRALVFVAAVDNHTIEVIDLKSGQRVDTITDLAEPQGVFYDASSNRLFVACALDGVAKIFDGTTFQVLASAKFPDDSDNIRYDARDKRVIVGYAGAKELRKRTEGTGGLSDGARRSSSPLIRGNLDPVANACF
jgi:DNA-binding beta-propeller fold protein YncE